MDQNRIWQVWQKNCEPATNVCEHHGKRLKTPRQKFVEITAKVYERHGKSLITTETTPRRKCISCQFLPRSGETLRTRLQEDEFQLSCLAFFFSHSEYCIYTLSDHGADII